LYLLSLASLKATGVIKSEGHTDNLYIFKQYAFLKKYSLYLYTYVSEFMFHTFVDYKRKGCVGNTQTSHSLFNVF